MDDLTPVDRIVLPVPMTGAAVARVMRVLNAVSGRPAALFVGGCVRNALAGQEISDIDIATLWTPDQVIEKLNAADIKTIPTGIDHGTITAVADGATFEITTLRRDVATDGRRAVVAFSADWREDAQRRDFTMNTLLADGVGNIYDPTGRGVDDLRAGRVIFVGDPAQRIAEDYLRILRFFRFYGRYGAGAPDGAALVACRAAGDRIADLSRERITQEFIKILSLDNAVDIIKLMFANNVLSAIPASGYDPQILRRLCAGQRGADPARLAARLVVLAGFDEKQVEAWDKTLLLSSEQKKAIADILKAIAQGGALSEKSIKVMIYKYKNNITIQSVSILSARNGVDYNELCDLAQEWRPPVFPLNGKDLAAAGVPEGPRVGQILSAIENWWIEQDFIPDHAACLDRLRGEIC